MDNPSTPPPLTGAGVTKTSTLAIISLVLGILGFFTCGLTAVFGVVLGIIALIKVKNSNGALTGSGLALAGIIVSGLFILMIPIFAAMLLPALASAKLKTQEINCMTNEKQLALAVIIYSGDNTNYFPASDKWCDAIKETVGTEKVFKCVSANTSSRCDYAFNSKLGGIAASNVNPQTVLIFESNTGWNASGGPELLATPARHNRGRASVVAFVDGHVEIVEQSRLNTLRWEP